MEPKLLARYRPSIVDGLRRALAGDEPLYRVLRVHVGLEGESGAPMEAFGKLIRSAVALLIAEEFDGDPEDALSAAVALELVHEFSLVHDGVQDGDETRRGRPTVWSRWGEAEAVNAGDLMLVLALTEAKEAGDAALKRLLVAVIELVEGQAIDVSLERRWPSMDEYVTMIDKKTGALFRYACELGAILAGAPRAARTCLNEIGRELGRAYQIRNDLRGIWGSETELGKPIGADFPRRKKTYPVIVAAAKACEGDRRILEAALAMETISEEAASGVVEMMERLGVREDGAREVNRHLENVLSGVRRLSLGETGERQMIELCESLRPTMAIRGAR